VYVSATQMVSFMSKAMQLAIVWWLQLGDRKVMAITGTRLKSLRRDLPPTTEAIEIKFDVSRDLTMYTREPDFIGSG